MICTPKIESAVRKAAILHQKQFRKGGEQPPYITHLFSVFLILTLYTEDEDTLVAGLLHDSLEDTNYTSSEIERDFGTRVRSIVEGVTEKKGKEEEGRIIGWEERKQGYIKTLESAPIESLYVSAADKIHNFSSVLRVYKENREAFKKDFEMRDRIHFYSRVVEVITKRLGKEHALVKNLNEHFERYALFLKRVYN